MNERATVSTANKEYALVQTAAFGIFMLCSFTTVFSSNWGKECVFTNSTLVDILAIEIFSGSVALFILKMRGWGVSDFDLKFRNAYIFQGILLFLVTFTLSYLTSYIITIFNPGYSALFRTENLSLILVLLVVIINPLFEEFFVTVYPSEVLVEHHGVFFTISICSFVRFAYHAYQGPISVTILILGIINTFTYLKWRKMWPLVISHSINNYIFFTFN